MMIINFKEQQKQHVYNAYPHTGKYNSLFYFLEPLVPNFYVPQYRTDIICGPDKFILIMILACKTAAINC